MSLLMSSDLLDRLFGKEGKQRFVIKSTMLDEDWFFVDFEAGKPHAITWSKYENEAMIFSQKDEGSEFAEFYLIPRKIRIERLS